MTDEERSSDSGAEVDETAEILPGPGPSTVVDEISGVAFPVVRRGYDREAVETYVARVSQLVAELDATRSPQHAVKRALERVGEETASILRQAQETAQQMTARAEARGREREQQAEREARRMKAEAQAEVRRLDADTDRIWEERQRLLEDTRKLAELLLRVADDAEERFPPELPEPSDSARPSEEERQNEDERQTEDSTDEVLGAAGHPVQRPSEDGPPHGAPPPPG